MCLIALARRYQLNLYRFALCGVISGVDAIILNFDPRTAVGPMIPAVQEIRPLSSFQCVVAVASEQLIICPNGVARPITI